MVIDFEIIKNINRRFSGKVLMIELKATRRIFAMKVIMKKDIDWVQTEKHVFETATYPPFLV